MKASGTIHQMKPPRCALAQRAGADFGSAHWAQPRACSIRPGDRPLCGSPWTPSCAMSEKLLCWLSRRLALPRPLLDLQAGRQELVWGAR